MIENSEVEQNETSITTEKSNVAINSKHKDRLFGLLFGDASNKENILSLYNALNDTDYKDCNDIEITPIDDVIYMSVKNDVSFLFDSYMTLWEQQSTYNPNMPVRGLIYYGRLYDAYVQADPRSVYGSTLIKLPTPKYVVFYNGDTNKDATITLKLSDAFMQKDDSGDFEWTATMINLNDGKNPDLLSKCKPLSDYMTLINKIKKYKKQGKTIEEAVELAIDECIEEDVLADFLRKHKAEVKGMCITEFDEKKFINTIREESAVEAEMNMAKELFLDNIPFDAVMKYVKHLSRETVENIYQSVFGKMPM